jgi:hypothetical protein
MPCAFIQHALRPPGAHPRRHDIALTARPHRLFLHVLTAVPGGRVATTRVIEVVEEACVLLQTQGPKANAYGIVTDIKGAIENLTNAMARLKGALQVMKPTDWPSAEEQNHIAAGTGKEVA